MKKTIVDQNSKPKTPFYKTLFQKVRSSRPEVFCKRDVLNKLFLKNHKKPPLAESCYGNVARF